MDFLATLDPSALVFHRECGDLTGTYVVENSGGDAILSGTDD